MKIIDKLLFLENGLYVIHRESGYGKSLKISQIQDKRIAVINTSNNKINTTEDLENLFKKYTNYKVIIIDELFDHFKEENTLDFFDVIPKNKVVVLSTNNSLISNGVLKFAENNDNKLKTFFMTDQAPIPETYAYIYYYWILLSNHNGMFHFNGKKFKMNEADFVTLLIASRYWGKAYYIFDYKYNVDKIFFNYFSEVFFHSHSNNYDITEFFHHIKVPSYLDIDKIKNYLGGDKLSFSIDKINKLLKNINVLKLLGFSKFLKCIKGRYYIAHKSDSLPKDLFTKYRKLFSNGVHSVDFVIYKLFAIKESDLDEALIAFEK